MNTGRTRRSLDPNVVSELVHEWATQLQAIVSATELVDMLMPKHPQPGGWEHAVREANHRVKVATDAMWLQIRDLKSRLLLESSAGDESSVVEQFTVNSLLADIRAAAKVFVPRNDVELVFGEPDPAVDGLLVIGEKQRLVQVARNLIENSIKYTERGYVRVGLTVAMRWSAKRRPVVRLVLSVEDTGIGIAPQDIARVTEPGYRSKSVKRLQGTGHGLAVVKRAADLMAARLKIRSSVGEGTTVVFDVELQAKALFADRPRVLVVDDELAPALQRTLTEIGCDVVSCTSADEAVAVFQWDRFDVVLMDINLGGGCDGVQLTKRLVGNARREGASTPIVAITAYRGSIADEDKERFARIIDKPASAATFAKVLQDVTGWDIDRHFQGG